MKFLAFQKNSRIRKRADYLLIQKKSYRVHTQHLLVCFARNLENKTPRLGIVATKKIGNAVARNRGKRLVREAFRRNQHTIHNLDVVVILKIGINELSQIQVNEELTTAFKRRK